MAGPSEAHASESALEPALQSSIEPTNEPPLLSSTEPELEPAPQAKSDPSIAPGSSPFGNLPAELRNNILQMALFPSTDYAFINVPGFRHPAVLHVSKQWRAEALPTFCHDAGFQASILMCHTYEEAMFPRRGHEKLNLPSKLLDADNEHLPSLDGPLTKVTYEKIKLFVMDVDEIIFAVIDIESPSTPKPSSIIASDLTTTSTADIEDTMIEQWQAIVKFTAMSFLIIS